MNNATIVAHPRTGRDTVPAPVPTTASGYGWIVTFAGTGINLALGILYTWSVISKGIPAEWGWTETQKSLPYAIACLVFSVVMVPAGRMQDRIGPRIVATVGGLLVGIGMILASYTTSALGYILGFGVLAGAGIGFGYASATPPAVKWFPARKTGLIAGLVVSGFGLASVYAAPLAKYLTTTYGLPSAMMILGVGFLIIVVALAQLLAVPPKGFVPAGSGETRAGAPAAKAEDFAPLAMLATWQFYVLWFMYACGAGAGLMIISKLAKIAQDQSGMTVSVATLLVSGMAIGNGAGRIVAGMLSDRIGRKLTLFICFVVQALAILALSTASKGSALANVGVMAILAALIGANYGANLALFPSVTKDYYGLKNFGVNYGLVFTAWGLGGFALSLLAGNVYDQTKSFAFAYYCSAGLLTAAALVTFLVRPPRPKTTTP